MEFRDLDKDLFKGDQWVMTVCGSYVAVRNISRVWATASRTGKQVDRTLSCELADGSVFHLQIEKYEEWVDNDAKLALFFFPKTSGQKD